MAGNIKGITIEIGGNTAGLNKALGQVNSEARKTTNELKSVEKALKMDPKNVDLLKQKQELLNKSIGETETKLDALKKAKEQADKDMANGTEVNEGQYRKLQREIVITENNLKGLKMQASGAPLQEFGTHLDDIGKKLNTAGEKIDEFGGKLTTGVTVPLLAVAAASVAAFTEVDDALDTVVTATGATGEALESLQDTVKDVASTTKFDVGDIGSAVGEVNTQFGSMGDVLQNQTERLLKFADITGADVVTSTQNARQAMDAYKLTADDLPSILDIVARTAQNTGVSVDKLFQAATDGSYQIRELGLSFEEGVAMMGQFEQSGVDSSKALTYMSKAAVEYAKDGKSLKDGLNETIESIKNASTETEALAIASEVFGTRGAVSMIEAINRGTFSLEGLQGAAADAKDAVNTTFENTLDPIDNAQVAMNNVKIALSELGGELQASFGSILEDVAGVLRDVTKWFQGLDDQTKQNIIRFGGLAAAAGPVVKIGGNVVSTVGKMTSYLGSAAKALGGASDKANLLSKSLTFLGSPTGLAVGATAIVAGLGIALHDLATKNLREAQETADKSRETFQEFAQAMDDASKSSDNRMRATDEEAKRISALNDELKNLVDSEGKVKEGSEERVDYILGELNDALGAQLSREGDQLQNYKDQGAEIDTLIARKKAQMQLNAQSPKLEAAQTAYDEGTARQIELRGELAEQTVRVTKAQADLNRAKEAGQRSTVTQESNLRTEQQALKKLQAQYDENAGVVDSAYAQIQQIEEGHLAFEQGNYEEISKILSSRNLVYTAAGKATKTSLATQAREMSGYYEELKVALEKGQEGVDADMVKNAEKLAIKATQEYQKVGGAIGEGLIVGIDEQGNPIYSASESMAGKAISGVKMGFKEAKAVVEALGFSLPDSLIRAISSMDSEVQQTTMQTLSKLNEGVTLSQPEIKELFSNLGIEAPDSLIKSMVGVQPSVYGEAISLLKNLESATEDEKPIILDQLNALGVAMDADLAAGIKKNRSQPVGEAKTTGKESLAGAQSELLAYNPEMPRVDGTAMVSSAETEGKNAWNAAQRAVTLFGSITIGVKTKTQAANGGIFNTPTDIQIGETYQKEYVINVQRPASGIPLLKSAAADMGYVLARAGSNYSSSNSNINYDDHSNINVYPQSAPNNTSGMRRMAREISAEQERTRRSYARGYGKR